MLIRLIISSVIIIFFIWEMDNPSLKELNLSPKTEDALSKSSASIIQRIQRKR